jgi:hypothetical protein
VTESREEYNARKRRNYAANREKALAATRRWQAKNTNHLAQYARAKKLRTFGLTPASYAVLLEEQEGRCAICARHHAEFSRCLAVDHCHATGKVRGLLCSGCNTGIGNLKEDIGVFQTAVAYLLKHQ